MIGNCKQEKPQRQHSRCTQDVTKNILTFARRRELPTSVSITYGNTGINVFYFFYKITRSILKRGSSFLHESGNSLHCSRWRMRRGIYNGMNLSKFSTIDSQRSKGNVFSLVLKIPSKSVALTTSGKKFHNLGSATEKALCSYVLVLDIGRSNIFRPWVYLCVRVGPFAC